MNLSTPARSHPTENKLNTVANNYWRQAHTLLGTLSKEANVAYGRLEHAKNGEKAVKDGVRSLFILLDSGY